VSKAVAGVLTMRLVEQGEFALGDATRTHAPTLPDHHTHTLGQLVSNRGCVRHYINNDPVNAQDNQYNTALAAAPLFWDDALVCTPGSYFYTTHGYTLLGAGLEGATGKSTATLVQEQIANAFNLPTLRAEDNSQSVKYRSKLYSGGAEVTRDNTSWKILGGGLEASTYDLARLGMKLLDGSVISDANRTTLWTPPNNASNYALGWSTGTDQGTPVVAKDGAWTGSRAYIRMYPDKGYTIALLSNQRGHNLPDLGRQLGTLLLDAEAVSAAGVAPLQPQLGALDAEEIEEAEEVVGSLGSLHLTLPIITNPLPAIRPESVPGDMEEEIVAQPIAPSVMQTLFLPAVMK